MSGANIHFPVLIKLLKSLTGHKLRCPESKFTPCALLIYQGRTVGVPVTSWESPQFDGPKTGLSCLRGIQPSQADSTQFIEGHSFRRGGFLPWPRWNCLGNGDGILVTRGPSSPTVDTHGWRPKKFDKMITLTGRRILRW